MRKDLTITQNFIKSSSFVKYLIEQSDINKNDTVIEIGPGKGIITEQLAKECKKVVGIEYDTSLITGLRNKFKDFDNIEIISEDFLKWKLPNYKYKVFSNIPFNLTTDIITKLLESRNSPQSTYLIMQDKAAERFLGQPMGKNSQISILLKPFYDMAIVKKINRKQFNPMPKVDAVLVKFIKKEQPEIKVQNTQEYRDFVIYGFNQWKPTILKSFKNVFSYKQMGILGKTLKLENLKPTDLSVEQWLGMFETYLKYVPESKKDLIRGSELFFKYKHKGITKEHRTRSR